MDSSRRRALAWTLATLAAAAARRLDAADLMAVQAVARDAFPVFDDPPTVSAAQAERDGVVFARDAVLGVSVNGEARAYPIAVMGVHELGNDHLGGIPIAISW